MSRNRRGATTATLCLEHLDDRVLPSTIGAHIAVHHMAVAGLAGQAHHGGVRAEHHAALGFHSRAGAAMRFHAPMPMHSVTLTGTSALAGNRSPNQATPSGTNTDPEASAPANVDGPLQTVYRQYQAYLNGGSNGNFISSESFAIEMSGTSVGIYAHGNGTGSFSSYVAALTSLGMQVQASDAATATVEGMIPISALPNAAQLSQTLSLTALYRPMQR